MVEAGVDGGATTVRNVDEREMAEDRLTLDTIHDLLSARRRRYTLDFLHLYANPILLSDVVEQVIEWESHDPGADLMDDRLRTYTSLYHNHVPKLADAGVVTYDQSENMLELGEYTAQLRPYLERAANTDLDADDGALL